MKKKTLLYIAAAALVLLLLLGGFPLFSRLYYGRSQAATLLAWQLKKDSYTTEEAFQDYLAEKREENTGYYTLPADVGLSARPQTRRYGDLTCYVMNRDAASVRLVLYFPGGSYIDAPRAAHWQFLDALAGDAYTAIAVPLYPKLPARDAAFAYDALLPFYGALLEDLSPRELVFMGDSAGGGMALSFAMQLRNAGLPGPDKLILLSPWVDVTLTNPDIPAYEKKDPALDSEQLRHLGALWADEMDPADPIVSPLYGSFEDLGRITLFVGTDELLYPDIMRLDELLTEAGIDHDTIVKSGMFHVWPLYRAYHIPEAEEAFRMIVTLVTD